ncbi:MAG TPA: type II CRISPR RNA-guided endonuclease Cas9 [bacterium]|nr:type II CRISPR RNA-guided endonuclease Cas9 [bacterium]HPG47395.1 type II CRISPR RNA-guided endonuclease Cas9 [bacterium]HPM99692.1 type II CRISPR RNA-guided endonuclease Cas9 [bacterium]
MSKILGLDLGSNSIGWALIDDMKQSVVASGVRIFQEGVNRNTSGSEVSKNVVRRMARNIRRQNFRFRMRRDTLRHALQKLEMFPRHPEEENSFFKIDPYEIRKNGLSQKLTLFEIGRVLYHLNQHRGFLSNRKTASNEDGKLFQGGDNTLGIDYSREKLQTGAYQTLGEYLASINPHEERRRNRYTLRKWYLEEFEKLWQTQERYYPEKMNAREREFVKDVIFFQRRLRSQKGLVGYCTFEPKKRCSPKSSPVFQYFRILEQVNRLRVTVDERINDPLTADERIALINELNQTSILDIKKIRKVLGLPPETWINLDTEKILGNHTYSEIRRIWGADRFKTMTEEEKYQIWFTIHFAYDDEWLKKYAEKNWGLDEKQIDKLIKNNMESKPNDGYAHLSHKAMKKIMPFLEHGVRYDEAAANAGYHQSQMENIENFAEYLPDPDNIRNPIVQQALFQLKKVVNTLIQNYGKPDIIRVELARELKLPKQKREQMRFENLERQQEHEKIRTRLENEHGFNAPGRDDIIKYRLFEECGGIDPYSGDHIPISDLFSGRYEIEHIIPYSRSLDDSFANKTLCRSDYNRKKSNQTPYEAFGHLDEYEFMLNRVRKFKSKNAHGKLQKFAAIDVDKQLSDEFFHRQLNDSAYIARQSRQYLGQICKKVNVVNGRTTSKLRYLWGLNSILSDNELVKSNDDHRHHAVDAFVVALTTSRMLHSMSSYHKYNANYLVKEARFPLPWNGFRQQVEESIERIFISHHFRNRVRGQLHEETNYGRIVDPESGEQIFVVRKQLTSLSGKNVTNIVNPETRALVFERLRAFGITPGQKKIQIPKDAFAEPLVHAGTGHPIKSVRVKIPASNMIQLYSDRKLFVEPGNNHHIEIFASKDGQKRTGYVVSLFEAMKRKKMGEPVIDKNPRESKFPTFVMSLAINELFLFGKDSLDSWNELDPKEISANLYRVQKIDVNNNIVLRHHTISLSGQDDPGVLRKIPNTLQGIKVTISHIGLLEIADD